MGILDIGSNSVCKTHLQDDKLYIHTHFQDDPALERTKQLRNSQAFDKAKLGLHENEDMRAMISCPSVEQWLIFKKKHHETYKLLSSKHEFERMKGVRQIRLLHPEWVIQTRI